MEEEILVLVHKIMEYCKDKECKECLFHDMTVSHDCILMTGMPCNWDSKGHLELKQ